MRWEAEGSGEGEELAVMRNQSRECSEGGVSAMEDEGTLVGQDNTMCAGEQNVKPMEDRAELERHRFPILQDMELTQVRRECSISGRPSTCRCEKKTRDKKQLATGHQAGAQIFSRRPRQYGKVVKEPKQRHSKKSLKICNPDAHSQLSSWARRIHEAA